MAAEPRNVTLQKQEIEAHHLLSNSLNMLASRIEKTETDFIGHMTRLETRLDQIVDITKTVAVLQSQTTNATETIADIKKTQIEGIAKYETSIGRVHTRLDELSGHQRDRLELHEKEIDLRIDNFAREMKGEINTVSSTANGTEKEFKQWLNRGWGVWVVAVLIFGAVQAGIYRWVDAIEKEKFASTQVLQSLVLSKDRTEIFVKQHESETAELKSQVKRIDLYQRELEDMITRRSSQK